VTRLDTDTNPGIGADPDPAPEPVVGRDAVSDIEPYQLRVSYDAQRMLTQAPPAGLPSRLAWAAYRFVTGELLRDPTGVGVPLGAALAGVWSARRAGYRVLYEVDEGHRLVTVLVIRPDPA
jgi:mRNA-degrading endonuclease RelE of RelBE toxin-antitoxin system